jgi:23S rRNA (uracil1939-C5)-methyltransferase
MDSHRVVHIPNCMVHHPLINHVASVVRRALVDSRITSYSEIPHLGLARYLQVVVERSSQSAQVVLVANSATPEPLTECLNLIREQLGSHLHSLWYSANCERTNAILGPDIVNWCGPPSVVESFGGAQVHYPPGAFGQNYLDMAQSIIGHLGAQIPEGARITEFYAGVGAIGLSLLARAHEIRMNETNPHSLHGLELGLAQLSRDDRARVSVIQGPAGAAHLAAAGAQVVIADPPRKGLDSGLIGYLREQPPERFLYVSCGLDSLLRDTAQLISNGKLRLAALSAFDLLPYTEHIETVARFEPA